MVDSHVASAAIGLCLDVFFCDLARNHTLSVLRGRFIKVLFRSKVPVGRRKVEISNIPTSSIELLEGALFYDLAIFLECDNMVAIRKSLSC